MSVVTNGQKIRMLARWLGKPSVTTDGENACFCCPLCNEKRPEKKKLSIRLSDGTYHCWVCGLAGRSFRTLLQKTAPQALQDPNMEPLLGLCKRQKKETTWDELRQKIEKLGPKPYEPSSGHWRTDTSIFDD